MAFLLSRRRATRSTIELLEPRTLLSGYTFSQLAAFDGTTEVNQNTPYGQIVMDASGNVFGMTREGGNGSGGVFEIPKGATTPTSLALFAETSSNYSEGLVMDTAGNLFGTRLDGGTHSGAGYLFELPKGASTIQTVESFDDPTTGHAPRGQLLIDANDNIFGTCSLGGPGNGGGTIWELPKGATSVTLLATFPQAAAGSLTFPQDVNGDLIMDGSGNIFGTTIGAALFGVSGIIFELPHGSSTVQTLSTVATSDGTSPVGGVVTDSGGNLFGMLGNGTYSTNIGTVYELPSGGSTIQTLASLPSATGNQPTGPLVMDSSGNLFGTTSEGGNTSKDASGSGSVFELPKGGTAVTALFEFNHDNGDRPTGALLLDTSTGSLFGTTQFGGPLLAGVAYKLSPGGTGGGGASLSAGISAKLPTKPVTAGGKAKLSATAIVTNTGGAVNGTITGKLFLATGSTVDSNSIQITSGKKKVKLKSHKHFSLKLKVSTLSSAVPANVYHLVVEVIDPSGNISQAATTGTITVAAP